MATTPRWGLEYFGGDLAVSLADKGGKFTRGDRLVIDRILAALAAHDHSGGGQLDDPSSAPTLTLDAGAGSLDAGTTFYYLVTYVDQYGLETAASDEASVTTPVGVQPPQGPGLVAEAGGTLPSGLYMYALTASAGGGETTLSTLASMGVSDFKTVRVSIPGGMPAGADAISIWRQGPTETWFTRVRTQADALDWVDDGSVPADANACEPANQPPNENTTVSTNSVVIDAPAGDLTDPSLATRWRIYRTTTSGSYGPQSLVADVSDTVGGSQLVETYTDAGAVGLAWGSPPLASQTLAGSPEIEMPNGMLLLRATDDSVWQLTCANDGSVQTVAVTLGGDAVSSTPFADAGVSLVDSVGANWRVTVGTDGTLATAAQLHQSGERQYAYGRGPDLPTFDGTVHYRLGVTIGGALQTYGNRQQAFTRAIEVGVVGGLAHTFGASDAYKYLRCTNSALVTLTIPTNAAEPFEVGTVIQFAALGAAGILFAGDSGVVVNGAGNVPQYGAASIIKVATDEWDAAGAVT